jgi:hypothetical protein
MVDYVSVNSSVAGGYSSTAPEVFRGVYEFNLGSYGFTTVAASLRLSVVEVGFEPAKAIPFLVYGYTGNGQIAAEDYSAGTLVSGFTLSSLGTLEVDVSSFLSSAFARNDRFVGFNIRPDGDPYADDNYYIFATPAYGPPSSTLSLTQVPEPSAMSVAALGVGILGCRLCRGGAGRFRSAASPAHR